MPRRSRMPCGRVLRSLPKTLRSSIGRRRLCSGQIGSRDSGIGFSCRSACDDHFSAPGRVAAVQSRWFDGHAMCHASSARHGPVSGHALPSAGREDAGPRSLTTTMRTARGLLLAYTSLGPEEAGALFAEDGTLELPYLVEIGVESKYEGPENIVKVLGFVHNQLYPGFAFENVKIHLDTPEQ